MERGTGGWREALVLYVRLFKVSFQRPSHGSNPDLLAQRANWSCHVPSQDKIARIRKRKRGRNMLNRSGNTTDNLCFRYRFRDVFSRFRCCVYNGTGPLFCACFRQVSAKGNMLTVIQTKLSWEFITFELSKPPKAVQSC